MARVAHLMAFFGLAQIDGLEVLSRDGTMEQIQALDALDIRRDS
jgi:hypothetical protein